MNGIKIIKCDNIYINKNGNKQVNVVLKDLNNSMTLDYTVMENRDTFLWAALKSNQLDEIVIPGKIMVAIITLDKVKATNAGIKYSGNFQHPYSDLLFEKSIYYPYLKKGYNFNMVLWEYNNKSYSNEELFSMSLYNQLWRLKREIELKYS